jgi:hypothetical protein
MVLKSTTKRRQSAAATKSPSTPDESPTILQFRIFLKDVSPMVWRRVQVPSTMTLCEFHGVLQVAMGWESIHLYQFVIHAVRYGSWETAANSPKVALDDLKLRKGSRFLYEYDLNIPWEHEIRLEERGSVNPETRYPNCPGGDGNCPQEDCGGPEGWMWRQDNAFGYEMVDDLATTVALFQEISDTKSFAALEDPDRWEEFRETLERIEQRVSWQGQPFERRKVNERLRQGDHLVLMHQQM